MDNDEDRLIEKIMGLSPARRRLAMVLYACSRARLFYVALNLSPFTNADKALSAAGALLTMLSLLCLWLLWLDRSGHAQFVMYTIGVTGGAYTVSLTLLSAYRIIKRIGSLPA